jgi:nitroreductase
MSLYDSIVSRRTIRQFRQDPPALESLQKMVNAARLAPSAANRQPLEFIIINEPEVRSRLFPLLKWAGYITPRGNPQPGQEPTAYIVVLANTSIREKGYEWDAGAAVENIILTAWEEGIGTCWLASIDRQAIGELLHVPSSFKIDAVVALGYPAEQPVVEELDGSVEYWKDESGRLHVPKRPLDSVIHYDRF